MSWSTIRKATEEDRERLNRAAMRFCERHDCPYVYGSPVENVEAAIANDFYDGVYLRKLWRACVRRALRSNDAEGIEYGYVGFHVE